MHRRLRLSLGLAAALFFLVFHAALVLQARAASATGPSRTDSLRIARVGAVVAGKNITPTAPSGAPVGLPEAPPGAIATQAQTNGANEPAGEPTASPETLPSVRINEYLPRPETDWNGDGEVNEGDEYVELYNLGPEAADLSGWTLDDLESGGSPPFTFADGTVIEANSHLLLFGSTTGIVLSNSSDYIVLRAADGRLVEILTYTSPNPDTVWQRKGDGADDWTIDWPPSPGAPNRPPPTPAPSPTPSSTLSPASTASATLEATSAPTGTSSSHTPSPSPSSTPTPTITSTPTVDPNAPVRLNEVLPAPERIDWDGNGTASTDDEWIELVNTGSVSIDLGGWQLDDAAGGSKPYVFPAGLSLAPATYLVLFRAETGLALNNNGDEVRLLRPDGSLHDHFAYSRSTPDASFALGDDALWHDDWPPSPGAANRPPPTPTAYPTTLRLNEVMPVPKSDWNGDGRADLGDEYIEVLNLGPLAVDLGGYRLDDDGGTAAYTIPGGTLLAPGGVRAFFRGQTGITLNDSGDTLRLFGPDGKELDLFQYSTTGADQAWSRDETGSWTSAWPPSPNRPNEPPAPPPTATPGLFLPLLISEVVYDGTQPGDGDEFVELYNPTGTPVNLVGWGIGDEVRAGGGEGFYRFPDRILAPGAVAVVARSASAFRARFGMLPDFELEPGDEDLPEIPNLSRDRAWGRGRWALNNSGDEVVLVDPENRRVDALAFRNGDFAALGLSGHNISAPAPKSLNRVADWRGSHLNDLLVYQHPSPGAPLPLPEAPPAPPAPAFGAGLFAFWGSLHAHSSYSDGSGPPAYAYAVARANGQHFLAISDHSNWFSAAEWEALGRAADEATDPGRFVGFRAFEWTHRENGHVNVFASDDFISRDAPEGDTLADLYTFLATRPGAIGQFNHPFPGDFDDLRFEPAARAGIALIELANGRPGYTLRAAETYWQALFRGWRLGAAANPDTETADWGADSPLRTGVLAPALDRASLLDAIRARRTFATEDPTLALALRAGDTWMGDEIEPGRLSLTVLATDLKHEAGSSGQGETALELWREGAPVATTRLRLDNTLRDWVVQIEARPGEVLVARAVQPNGAEAWTSPLFVRGEWAPPGLRLSEVMPAPQNRDFNGDGRLDSNDEYVEIYNPLDRPVGLGGWQVDDKEGGSPAYTLPLGTVLPPRSYLVIFKSQSGVAFDQVGDSARLIAPNGEVVDEVHWSRFPGYDSSVSRAPNGGWIVGTEPSPGGPTPGGDGDDSDDGDEERGREGAPPPAANGGAAPASAPDTLTSLAEARRLPLGRTVTVRGQVSAPPGPFGEDTMYIQDSGAGLKVYLRDEGFPALSLGDWVEVTGRLGSFARERELRPLNANAVRRLGPGRPPVPLPARTGDLASAEGLLVLVEGQVMEWTTTRWTLDDSSGPAKVVIRRTTGLRRPWLERGEQRAAVGIVGRDGDEVLVLPRMVEDLAPGLAPAPEVLPVTGGSRIR